MLACLGPISGYASAQNGNAADAFAAWVARCEAVFPQVMRDPGAAGGLFLERFRGKNLACLFGSHAERRAATDQTLGRLAQSEIVVAMSSGGPVAAWLEIGSAMAPARPVVIVDRICASSCANYIAPIAGRILAVSGSLLVWHGGPDALLTQLGREDDIRLRDRAQSFTASTGISAAIFAYSAAPASSRLIQTMQDKFGEQISTIDGYAFAPQRLRRCFGFSSVDEMWHPGQNREVFLAGKSLNKSLVLLEAPDINCP